MNSVFNSLVFNSIQKYSTVHIFGLSAPSPGVGKNKGDDADISILPLAAKVPSTLHIFRLSLIFAPADGFQQRTSIISFTIIIIGFISVMVVVINNIMLLMIFRVKWDLWQCTLSSSLSSTTSWWSQYQGSSGTCGSAHYHHFFHHPCHLCHGGHLHRHRGHQQHQVRPVAVPIIITSFINNIMMVIIDNIKWDLWQCLGAGSAGKSLLLRLSSTYVIGLFYLISLTLTE